jgi:hypothetical protein
MLSFLSLLVAATRFALADEITVTDLVGASQCHEYMCTRVSTKRPVPYMFSWSGGTPPYFAEVQTMYNFFRPPPPGWLHAWLSEEVIMSLHPYAISSFAPTICQSYLAQLQIFNNMTDTSIFRPQAIKGPFNCLSRSCSR